MFYNYRMVKTTLKMFMKKIFFQTWVHFLYKFDYCRQRHVFVFFILEIMLEVTCNDRLGKKVRVKCNPDDTIGDLKKLIAAQTGTRWEKIVLKKWYTIFKDHIKLQDCILEWYYKFNLFIMSVFLTSWSWLSLVFFRILISEKTQNHLKYCYFR